MLSLSLCFSLPLLAKSVTSFLTPQENQLTHKVKPKISIVIDDLGDNSIIAKKLLSLPGQMTAAILPQTPHAITISNFAANKGHEIIMHLPMEAFTRPDLLGPGALLSSMDQSTFINTFKKDIESIPNIIGFNNHMGSLLTENTEKMQWLMEEAKNQSFFFLDSKTSQDSIAESTAKITGIASIGRDVFLDHKGHQSSIEEQFSKLKKIARKRGHVVVICHPYAETFKFLQQHITSLNQEFELVGLSQLLIANLDSIEKIKPQAKVNTSALVHSID